MKKQIIVDRTFLSILIIFFFVISGASASLSYPVSTDDNNMIPSVGGRGYTHTVFVESFTATFCGPCAPAAAEIYDIYTSGGYDFYYVSFIVDVNNVASQRAGEYGVGGIPDYVFDGGYRRVVGAQDLPRRYTNAIQDCGNRYAPQIGIDIDVIWEGDSVITVNVSVENIPDTLLLEKPDQFTNSSDASFSWASHGFNGRLRAYIVEKTSRWQTSSGADYHFGLLDYAYNSELSLDPGEAYYETTTWDGAAHGFGDISSNNIMIIAAVFDETLDYVVNTAVGEPSSPPSIVPVPHQNISYSYRLVNYENIWSDWSENTTITYEDLSDGEYNFQVKAKNGIGEEDPPTTWPFTLDQILPNTTLLSGPEGVIEYRDVFFEWIGDDTTTSVNDLEYSTILEGYDTIWSPWSSSTSRSYSFLTRGDYEFKVKTRDQAGNQDNTPATRSFTVDLEAIPPETILTEGPEGDIEYNDVIFLWTGTDNQSPVENLTYSTILEGYESSWSSWTSLTSKIYYNLPNGAYTFHVKARDDVWNEDPTPANTSFTVFVETNPPETMITSGPAGTISETSVQFEWIGSDDTTPTEELQYSYKLLDYNSQWSPWTTETSTTYVALPSADYEFLVKAQDNAGNEDPTPASQTFTITQPPHPPRNPQPENGSINIDTTIDLSWDGGDPDPEDSVTYDVYFGTTPTPPKVSDNHTASTYDPDELDLDETYYWKIISWDNNHISTKGPLWHFTTGDPSTYNLTISDISGGLGLTIEIENTGENDLNDITISTEFENGLLPLPRNRKRDITIDYLASGDTETVHVFVFGLGNVDIMIEATCIEAMDSKEAEALVVGPFVLNLSIK